MDNINFDFSGLHLRNNEIDGRYTFGALIFREGDEIPVFENHSIFSTGNYSFSEFESSSVTITNVAYEGVDDDGNGLFDSLKATLKN